MIKYYKKNKQINDGYSFNHTPSEKAKNAFFYLQSSGMFFCKPDYCTKRKDHDSFLLIYTISGKGYSFYRNKNYMLTPGKLLLIDCIDYQEYYSDKTELWNFKYMHFNGAVSREYYKIIFDKLGPVIPLDNSSIIIKYINTIISLMKNMSDDFEVKSSNLIMLVLTEILLTGADSINSPAGSLNIEKLITYIKKNYSENITVDDIASISKLSKYHFIREFKKASGYTPYEYLVKYRITQAKYLLENTSLSISEISYKTGFNNPGNFIRKFKELENLTPGNYRNNKFI